MTLKRKRVTKKDVENKREAAYSDAKEKVAVAKAAAAAAAAKAVEAEAAAAAAKAAAAKAAAAAEKDARALKKACDRLKPINLSTRAARYI
jgi:colicin import membrane protein